MRRLIFSALVIVAISGCKKKICGIVQAKITSEAPTGGAMYELMLESGETIRVRTNDHKVGEMYCN